MTYQPPPPPPSGTPPAGPGGRSGFDPKTINPLDWAAIGAGVLAFVFSFISFYTADVGISGACPAAARAAFSNETGDLPSASAWHGFFGWFGVLAALVGAALIAVSLFAPQVSLPVPARLAALGAFALATLSEILALFITPGGSYSSGDLGLGSCRVTADVGHGFGYWATLIVVIAGLVVALMRFQQTGGELPGGMNGRVPNIGGYGPQGGLSGSTGGPRPGPGAGPGQSYDPPPPLRPALRRPSESPGQQRSTRPGVREDAGPLAV